MTVPLDDQKLEALRDWGGRLAEDARDDVRAAGRAILVLVEEVARLRHALADDRAASIPAPGVDVEAGTDDVQSGLRARLAQLARRHRDDVSGPEAVDAGSHR